MGLRRSLHRRTPHAIGGPMSLPNMRKVTPVSWGARPYCPPSLNVEDRNLVEERVVGGTAAGDRKTVGGALVGPAQIPGDANPRCWAGPAPPLFKSCPFKARQKSGRRIHEAQPWWCRTVATGWAETCRLPKLGRSLTCAELPPRG